MAEVWQASLSARRTEFLATVAYLSRFYENFAPSWGFQIFLTIYDVLENFLESLSSNDLVNPTRNWVLIIHARCKQIENLEQFFTHELTRDDC